MPTNHIHDGHRERMKKKFVKHGLEIFEDHEMLEMLMFYSVPRKNTNEMAHRLINQFGSITKVFNADIELLQEVEGITQNTATLIKMVPAMLRVFTEDFFDGSVNFRDTERVREMLTRLYAGTVCENIKVIYLNLNLQCVGCETICESNQTYSVMLEAKTIVQRAGAHKCVNIVLVHNHPEDTCTPSSEDIRSTRNINLVLRELNINLVDHVIFSNLDNEMFSMADNGYLIDNRYAAI
jgi:DNA repair protein RadC